MLIYFVENDFRFPPIPYFFFFKLQNKGDTSKISHLKNALNYTHLVKGQNWGGYLSY
jgi:hypothetical protein